MTSKRTMTIVFEINDMEAFEKDHPNIKELALSDYVKDAPYTVSGISLSNEMRRISLLEESIDRVEMGVSDEMDLKQEFKEILDLSGTESFNAFRFYEDGKEVEPGHLFDYLQEDPDLVERERKIIAEGEADIDSGLGIEIEDDLFDDSSSE